MAEGQYRHEDVALVPKGHRVRTVLSGQHRVRVAFPPGPRRKGSGKLVAVLHPKSEKNCALDKRKLNSLLAAIGSGAAQGAAAAVTLKALGSRLANRKNGAGKNGRRRNQPGGGVLSVRYLPQRKKFRVEFLDGAVATVTEAWVRRAVSAEVAVAAKKAAPGEVLVTARSVLSPLRRPNQGDAQRVNEEFHGRPLREILEIQEKHVKAGDYAALGDLVGLWLEPVSGETSPYQWPKPTILFAKADKVKLATDAQGRQLFLIGGDQRLPVDYLQDAGLDTDKRFVPLGVAYGVSYATEKSFDNFETSEYTHELGEQTGMRPTAYYDQETERILLVGGAYRIAPLDRKLPAHPDVGGASPGIVN